MANKGRLTTGIFCLFLAGLLAWHIALPDRARSETENRTLAQFPDFSWETLKNGSFTAGMEDYFADQFPLRDGWTGLKARCEQMLGKREFNGVYLCGDTLIAKVDEPDRLQAEKNLDYVKRFGEAAHGQVLLGLIPSAAEVWKDRLPQGAPSFDQAAFIQSAAEKTGLPTVDLLGALTEHAGEPIYYRTDHHWNNIGSYRGYREAAALLGCTDLLEPLETVRVDNHFSGSKALLIGAQEQFFEPMDLYRFAFPNMSVTIAGEPADDYGRQDAALSGQIAGASYSGIYGNDDGEIILDTGTAGRGNLLMIGESYDNAILKLIAAHFDRVYSVDLRSYEQDMGKPFRMAEYLREHDITKVLWIGSLMFYTSDVFTLED